MKNTKKNMIYIGIKKVCDKKKSPPAETACKQKLPPAAKTRMMF